MSRKRYPEEFKIEAVKQVTEAGYSAYDVAERLGTVAMTEDLEANLKIMIDGLLGQSS
jgi:transposase-like protein